MARWVWFGALVMMASASASAGARDEGPTVDGKKHGTWREYGSTGQLEWERPFLFGERHGDVLQYGNGCDAKKGERIVIARTSYVMGEKDGAYTWFHCDGQVNTSGAYLQGREHGTWTWTRRNGTKIREGEYVCGHEFGPWSEWDHKGVLKKTETKAVPAGFRCPDDPVANFDEAVHDAWLATICDGPIESHTSANACTGIETCKRKPKAKQKSPAWCVGFTFDGFERMRCYTHRPTKATSPPRNEGSTATGEMPSRAPATPRPRLSPHANRCSGGVRG